MINSMTRNSLTLAGFALASALVVALTHQVTAEQINLQRKQQLLSAISEITPQQLNLEQLQQQCHQIQNPELLGGTEPKRFWTIGSSGAQGTTIYETVAPDGYNGSINLLVAVAADHSISGVRVTSHNETPGLGDKVELRKSDWVLGFNGQWLSSSEDSRWAVKKDGGQFDAFTGATITPRAVVTAVKKVLQLNHIDQNELLTNAQSCTL